MALLACVSLSVSCAARHRRAAPVCHRKLRRRLLWLATAFLYCAAGSGLARERMDLGGRWRFVIDPLRLGEKYGWHEPAHVPHSWNEVDVPHCWPTDPRYPYTGAAWYRRTFTVQTAIPNPHARLIFHGVFYRSRMWLNGRLLGEHEGGYTAFEMDATRWIQWKGQNTLAIEVDNSWSTNTLPGARIGPLAQQQVYPWWEYGGIVRPLELVITGPVYTARQRVISTPDLVSGGATINVTSYVRNAGNEPAKVRLALDIAKQAAATPVATSREYPALAKEVAIPPQTVVAVTMETRLPRKDVQLWDPDHANLYTVRSRIWNAGAAPGRPADEAETAVFGIRKIELRGHQILLNGEPIRMGGGNRHVDHPRFGSIEPLEVVDADMRQMKAAGMEFSRIIHYPVSETLLDWADRYGHLIIEEAPNWQLTEEQMDSAEIRAKFRAQTREMLERDWNHPSILGWSVGNEYPSDTPSGVRWTRDMMAFVKEIDPSRLVTIASNRADSEKLASPSGEASYFVDFPSVNLYGTPESIGKRLDLLRARHPGKPIFVSEFGARSTTYKTEDERAAYLRRVIAEFRARPFVVGASIWTYADYRSRYPWGTEPDGYRYFGMVTAKREPRASYGALAAEFSAATVADLRARAAGRAVVVTARVGARKDFPSYVLRDYSVEAALLDNAGRVLASARHPLPALTPGAESNTELRLDAAPPAAARVRFQVVRPTGIVMASETVPLARP